MKKLILFLLLLLVCGSVLMAAKPPKPQVKPLVTFVELGSVNCIPCKMMKPVMAEVQKEYGSKIRVIFHDINKDRAKATEFKIRVIPTQVFLDQDGSEFFRHEGFFPKAELMKIVDRQMGIKRKTSK